VINIVVTINKIYFTEKESIYPKIQPIFMEIFQMEKEKDKAYGFLQQISRKMTPKIYLTHSVALIITIRKTVMEYIVGQTVMYIRVILKMICVMMRELWKI
jgi:hypothetical protein